MKNALFEEKTMNKKKFFICSLLVILLYLILSCENPMSDGGARQDNAYTVVYHANGGTGGYEGYCLCHWS
jgi:hypothetical protein